MTLLLARGAVRAQGHPGNNSKLNCHCCVFLSFGRVAVQFCKLGVVHCAAGHEELAGDGAAATVRQGKGAAGREVYETQLIEAFYRITYGRMSLYNQGSLRIKLQSDYNRLNRMSDIYQNTYHMRRFLRCYVWPGATLVLLRYSGCAAVLVQHYPQELAFLEHPPRLLRVS
jgi:hypothetical protein